MEKDNEIKTFNPIKPLPVKIRTVKEKSFPVKKGEKKMVTVAGYDKDNATAVTIDGTESKVQVIIVNDEEEDYSLIKTLHDVIALDKRKPQLVAEFKPPLYKEFTNSRGQILTHVKVGDKVKLKPIFSDEKAPRTLIVKEVRTASLYDMTIIVATFDNYYPTLTTRLEVCK
jgi:hypothetical protein